jgi:proteasome lid subunit RPN8/RPN11
MFPQSVIDAAKAHAIAEYPRESCGLVVAGEYLPRKNVAKLPNEEFRVSTRGWTSAMERGPVEAVIHSHPDGPACPTAADMEGQERTAMPWGIIVSSEENAQDPFWFGDQVPIDLGQAGLPPLVGRIFRHGVQDCYDTIRDWYWLERGIRLPNFARDWEWWLPLVVDAEGRHVARVKNGPKKVRWEVGEREFVVEGRIAAFPHEHAGFTILAPEHLYADNFAKAGFHEISEREVDVGDVFLATIGSCDSPNHGGVYVGGGLGLHHMTSREPVDFARVSKREPIARWREKYITKWLRHGGSGEDA